MDDASIFAHFFAFEVPNASWNQISKVETQEQNDSFDRFRAVCPWRGRVLALLDFVKLSDVSNAEIAGVIEPFLLFVALTEENCFIGNDVTEAIILLCLFEDACRR